MRKLAEQTKGSVEQVTSSIARMDQTTFDVRRQTEEMEQDIFGHVNRAQEAIGSLDHMMQLIKGSASPPPASRRSYRSKPRQRRTYRRARRSCWSIRNGFSSMRWRPAKTFTKRAKK
ncbi:hypothetical protein VQ056_27035 [Paenibacillus sp. JTLBN-2024]